MPKIGNPQQENMGKIIEGNYPSSTMNPGTTSLHKTGRPNTNVIPSVLPLRYLPHMWLEFGSDEVVVPVSTEEIISLTLWKTFSTSGTANKFFLS